MHWLQVTLQVRCFQCKKMVWNLKNNHLPAWTIHARWKAQDKFKHHLILSPGSLLIACLWWKRRGSSSLRRVKLCLTIQRLEWDLINDNINTFSRSATPSEYKETDLEYLEYLEREKIHDFCDVLILQHCLGSCQCVAKKEKIYLQFCYWVVCLKVVLQFWTKSCFAPVQCNWDHSSLILDHAKLW